MKLEIITPEKIAYTDDVDMVIVPSAVGKLGILPKHIPLFAKLTQGELKIKKGTDEIFLSIGGGFVEVTKTKVVILVTRAVNADELTEAEIMRAKKEAEDALAREIGKDERTAALTVLRRSLLDLKVLRRRKRTH